VRARWLRDRIGRAIGSREIKPIIPNGSVFHPGPAPRT